MAIDTNYKPENPNDSKEIASNNQHKVPIQENEEVVQKTSICTNWKSIFLGIGIFFLLVKAFIRVMPSQPIAMPPSFYIPRVSSEDNSETYTVLRMVSRNEWLATPEKYPLDSLKLPVHRVIIAHTTTDSCTSQSECVLRTHVLQQFHMDSRYLDDIAYNFLVGGEGAVYEGRGWDNQGAHTKGFNVDSICIAFIGTFETVKPPDVQLNAAKLIINEGVRLNKIVSDYRLYGARQMMGTVSPGTALYGIIKKWPNWSDQLE